MTALFTIDQIGKPAGVRGRARNDIAVGVITVDCSDVHTLYSWSIVSEPEGTPAVIDSPLAATTDITLVETGSYLISLTVDAGLITEQTIESLVGIVLPNMNLPIPAVWETNQDNSVSPFSGERGSGDKLTAIFKWLDAHSGGGPGSDLWEAGAGIASLQQKDTMLSTIADLGLNTGILNTIADNSDVSSVHGFFLTLGLDYDNSYASPVTQAFGEFCAIVDTTLWYFEGKPYSGNNIVQSAIQNGFIDFILSDDAEEGLEYVNVTEPIEYLPSVGKIWISGDIYEYAGWSNTDETNTPNGTFYLTAALYTSYTKGDGVMAGALDINSVLLMGGENQVTRLCGGIINGYGNVVYKPGDGAADTSYSVFLLGAYGCNVSGDFNIVSGLAHNVSGAGNFVGGYGQTVPGWFCTTIGGSYNTVNGFYTRVVGEENGVDSDCSDFIGYSNQSSSSEGYLDVRGYGNINNCEIFSRILGDGNFVDYFSSFIDIMGEDQAVGGIYHMWLGEGGGEEGDTFVSLDEAINSAIVPTIAPILNGPYHLLNPITNLSTEVDIVETTHVTGVMRGHLLVGSNVIEFSEVENIVVEGETVGQSFTIYGTHQLAVPVWSYDADELVVELDGLTSHYELTTFDTYSPGETHIKVKEAIPADVPDEGVMRFYWSLFGSWEVIEEVIYLSRTEDTFTLAAGIVGPGYGSDYPEDTILMVGPAYYVLPYCYITIGGDTYKYLAYSGSVFSLIDPPLITSYEASTVVEYSNPYWSCNDIHSRGYDHIIINSAYGDTDGDTIVIASAQYFRILGQYGSYSGQHLDVVGNENTTGVGVDYAWICGGSFDPYSIPGNIIGESGNTVYGTFILGPGNQVDTPSAHHPTMGTFIVGNSNLIGLSGYTQSVFIDGQYCEVDNANLVGVWGTAIVDQSSALLPACTYVFGMECEAYGGMSITSGYMNINAATGAACLGGFDNQMEQTANVSAILGGNGALAYWPNSQVFACGYPLGGACGDMQSSRVVVRNRTTDDSATPLYISGSEAHLEMYSRTDGLYFLWVQLAAYKLNSAGQCKTWIITATAINDGGTLYLVGVPNISVEQQTNLGTEADWDARVVVYPESVIIGVEVNGAVYETIDWFADVRCVEMIREYSPT